MARIEDKLPDVRSKDAQTARGTSIGAVKAGNGFKPGPSNAPKGSKISDVSANGRTWEPQSRKSGNTYKAKPGAK